jgi:glucose/arabinose dehydrogenase
MATPAMLAAQETPAANQTFTPRPGLPPGSSRGDLTFPQPRLVPGDPIETRPTELATDTPAFPGQTRAPYRPTTSVTVTTITDQLNLPWSLGFLPGGKMLVTEKPGTMRIVSADGTLSAPLSGVPKVHYRGQVGLLDLAIDPRFVSNHRVFFTFMEPVGEAQATMAVARATLNEKANALEDLKVIFDAKPALTTDRSGNAGGRLVIARDGTLFIIIGDRVPATAAGWELAQHPDTHLGKMIHITTDGKPAAGNPFIGKPGYLPEIWSLGHRSEEGLAFDRSGRLWETEHGPRGGDELNLIEPGKNYGWPIIAHGREYDGPLINGGKTAQAGMEQPRYYWDPVIAPSGLAFYDGSLFPEWKNSVLIGALRGQMLDRLTISGDKVVDEEPLLTDLHKRIRDVRIGPDAAVYVLTDEAQTGKLLKLTPKKLDVEERR